MKIAVIGAGAVGYYYGLKLARAGHQVALIGRPQASAVQRAQLVLFCLKSADTESGAAAIKPHLTPGAVVLTLQNGVENADRLRALLPRALIAAGVPTDISDNVHAIVKLIESKQPIPRFRSKPSPKVGVESCRS